MPENARIGYARVSTDDQSLALQLDALKAAGCSRIFQDKGISGAARCRPALQEALSSLKPGDVLVTWRLDRLGRSLGHLIEMMGQLETQGVGFLSLTESIDTTTPGGMLIFHVMGALAQFERSLISERTKAGMRSAKTRGRTLGRPAKLAPQQVEDARRMQAEGTPLAMIAAVFGVSKLTVSRALKASAAPSL